MNRTYHIANGDSLQWKVDYTFRGDTTPADATDDTDIHETIRSGFYGTDALKATRTFDPAGRLDKITNLANPDSPNPPKLEFDYGLDARGLRTDALVTDTFSPLLQNTRWNYRYDDKGQVTNGWQSIEGQAVYKNTPTANPQNLTNPVLPGRQFQYAYDQIGNRRLTKTGGTVTVGNGLSTETYTANGLNQIASVSRTAGREVTGVASPATDVIRVSLTGGTVNWAERLGDYFRRRAGTLARYPSIVVEQMDSTTDPTPTVLETYSEYHPPSTEAMTWDEDGNLASDYRWTYTWNAENQLVEMTTRTGIPAVVPRLKLIFKYDWMGRRIYKEEQTRPNDTAAWTWSKKHIFRYDGWNMVYETEAINGSAGKERAYVWGRDLSETRQGAGGVGGMILQWQKDTAGLWTPLFAAYDGNGNLSALVNSAGAVRARYSYDPFGNVLGRSNTTEGKDNPIGFSTKYKEVNEQLSYFGYRHYNTNLGSWTARDPINEFGGLNLFQFSSNNPATNIDYLGLNVAANPRDVHCEWDGQKLRPRQGLTVTRIEECVLDCEPFLGFRKVMTTYMCDIVPALKLSPPNADAPEPKLPGWDPPAVYFRGEMNIIKSEKTPCKAVKSLFA